MSSATTGDIDCLASLAHVALYSDWVRPVLVPARHHSPIGNVADNGRGVLTSTTPRSTPSDTLHLHQLRHPILESLLGTTHYVPSSLTLSEGQTCCLLTGPNMGGKSTFMRAVAICTILAHTGSFVPASHAIIPLVDKLFMRIGASDCTFSGESTFMREMLDVSNILQHATSRSMVLIDELGECSCVLTK